MKRGRNQKGFTIIEVVAVIGLMAILSGIAMPTIRRSNFTMRSYGQQLCADIREVRMSKMTLGGQYSILLSETYYKVLDGTKELKTMELPDPFELFYGNDEIRFNYQGVPIYGGDTITLFNKDSRRFYKITIVPASGRVLLMDILYGP
jgi:prepilin-type N-terminal cleavage/methylation domain-containing protein